MACYRSKQREPLLIELDRPDENEDGSGGDLYDRIVGASPSLFDNPDAVLANQILDQDLSHAIEDLPEDFRMAILLSDVRNFSYQEIAEMLNIPIGTVRSRIFRGRRLLQQALWKQAVQAGIVQDKAPKAKGTAV